MGLFCSSPYFVARRVGRWRWPWFLGGLVVALFGFFAVVTGASIASAILEVAGSETVADALAPDAAAFPTAPLGLATLLLLTGASFWVPAIFATFTQGLPLKSLVAPARTFDWSLVWKALTAKALLFAVPVGLVLLAAPDDGGITFTGFGVRHLIWLPPMLLIVLFQTSGEDVFFKGLLIHRLGALIPVLAVPPLLVVVLFTSLHLSNPDFQNLWPVLAIFALNELVIVYFILRTGGMEVAFVLHFVNNVVALLLFGDATTQANELTLFVVESPLSAENSFGQGLSAFIGATFWQAVFVVAISVERSPFYIERFETFVPPPPVVDRQPVEDGLPAL